MFISLDFFHQVSLTIMMHIFVLNFQLQHLQDVASAVGTCSWEKPHVGSDLQLMGMHMIIRDRTA
jgi:hypothetical protein